MLKFMLMMAFPDRTAIVSGSFITDTNMIFLSLTPITRLSSD